MIPSRKSRHSTRDQIHEWVKKSKHFHDSLANRNGMQSKRFQILTASKNNWNPDKHHDEIRNCSMMIENERLFIVLNISSIQNCCESIGVFCCCPLSTNRSVASTWPQHIDTFGCPSKKTFWVRKHVILYNYSNRNRGSTENRPRQQLYLSCNQIKPPMTEPENTRFGIIHNTKHPTNKPIPLRHAQ